MEDVESVFVEIYSSSLVDQLLMPPVSERISGASFTHLPSSSASPTVGQPTPRSSSSLRIVVDPSTIPGPLLESIPQPHVWWFVSPLHNKTTEKLTRGARIGEFSKHWLAHYVSPLKKSRPGPKPRLIVADTESHNIASSWGFEAVISPPAISDSAFFQTPALVKKARFLIPTNPNRYQKLFTDTILVPAQESVDVEALLPSDSIDLHELTIGISVGESILRGFPILAAAHLAAGHGLISEPLFPLHGLEPGIDYFDVTSPEELQHVTNYVHRHPGVARLMAYRGRHKAEYFRASRVWPRILDDLGVTAG